MKNTIKITQNGEELVSTHDDGTNRLFINDDEIPSSEWVGSGTYTTTIEGYNVSIAQIQSNSGNVGIKKIGEFIYSLYIHQPSGGGGSGTDDYDELINKPQINSVTLQGNKTAEQLNVQDRMDRITNSDIEYMLDHYVG